MTKGKESKKIKVNFNNHLILAFNAFNPRQIYKAFRV